MKKKAKKKIQIRIPTAPPTKVFKDKNKYIRKMKYKKGWDRENDSVPFSWITDWYIFVGDLI